MKILIYQKNPYNLAHFSVRALGEEAPLELSNFGAYAVQRWKGVLQQSEGKSEIRVIVSDDTDILALLTKDFDHLQDRSEVFVCNFKIEGVVREHMTLQEYTLLTAFALEGLYNRVYKPVMAVSVVV